MTEDYITAKIQRLSDEEKKLLSLKLKDLVLSGALEIKAKNNKKIIAYVKEDEVKNTEDLKSYLKSKIPDYMIPSNIYRINEFPFLPNGKIDRIKLQNVRDETSHANRNSSTDHNQPKNEIEEKLICIWEEVLGFSPIRINDNFFEIGGDSILSIQIVSKARKEGIHLKANQLFENQTISELTLFTSHLNQTNFTNINNKELEGKTALTPVQHWFFETHKNAPHFWNQNIELQNINSATGKTFKTIAKQLISNHEALRLSFKKTNNEWLAFIKASHNIESFHNFNLSSEKNINSQNERINDILIRIQENIKLSEGGLFKILFFDCDNLQPNRVILLAHHLVVDHVSWHIITNKIARTIKNTSSNFIFENENNKTGTVKDWSNFLEEFLEKNLISNELEYWKSQISDMKYFPTDYSSNSKTHHENSIIKYSNILDSEYTNSLIFKANEPYRTKVEDLLISALISTLCEWGDIQEVLLGLERQGRNTSGLDIDVSNTVGWFTSFFPISLGYNQSLDTGNHIKSIKEKLRTIPNNGLGFGVLRYLTNKGAESLTQLQPKIIFNYLGILNSENKNNALNFKFLESSTRDSRSERNYIIEINAQILNNNLLVNWSFTKDLYNEETAQLLTAKFLQNLKNTIDYCVSKKDISYTPSDFPEANLNQDDLDNLLSQF